MTHDEWILIAVCVATVGLMFGSRLRSDLIAILAALTLAGAWKRRGWCGGRRHVWAPWVVEVARRGSWARS